MTEIIGKAPIEPRIVKPYDLIHAYMLDIPIGPSLVEDTLFILQTSPRLIEVIYKFVLSSKNKIGHDYLCFEGS